MSQELHFFAIPALAPQDEQLRLNEFLARHRVVAIERQSASAGQQPRAADRHEAA